MEGKSVGNVEGGVHKARERERKSAPGCFGGGVGGSGSGRVVGS